MKKIKSYLILFLFLISCNNQEELTQAYIDTYTKLFSISKENILEIVQNSEFENLNNYLN